MEIKELINKLRPLLDLAGERWNVDAEFHYDGYVNLGVSHSLSGIVGDRHFSGFFGTPQQLYDHLEDRIVGHPVDDKLAGLGELPESVAS